MYHTVSANAEQPVTPHNPAALLHTLRSAHFPSPERGEGPGVGFVQSLQESQFEFQYKTEQCKYFHATGEVINAHADTWQERFHLLMQTIQEKTHAQH